MIAKRKPRPPRKDPSTQTEKGDTNVHHGHKTRASHASGSRFDVLHEEGDREMSPRPSQVTEAAANVNIYKDKVHSGNSGSSKGKKGTGSSPTLPTAERGTPTHTSSQAPDEIQNSRPMQTQNLSSATISETGVESHVAGGPANEVRQMQSSKADIQAPNVAHVVKKEIKDKPPDSTQKNPIAKMQHAKRDETNAKVAMNIDGNNLSAT
ncbi:unnamed protein product [Linum trigynum]